MTSHGKRWKTNCADIRQSEVERKGKARRASMTSSRLALFAVQGTTVGLLCCCCNAGEKGDAEVAVFSFISVAYDR